MSREDFRYRKIVGPFDWEKCPFGGSARILLIEDNNGNLMGKCELAERAWIQEESKSFLSSFDPGKVMRKDGCPHPPKWSWGKWRHRCKYSTGEYVYL